MKIASLLIVLPLIISQAKAFDAWGFRSGMSEAQVVAVAQREGYEANELTFNASANFHTLTFTRQDSDGSWALGYMASFCRHRLNWISHDYKATIGTLFELLQELKAQYGTATAETTSNMTSDGRARSIDFKFAAKPNDVVYIASNLNLSDDTSFGIQVIHHTSEQHCE